MKLTLCVSSFTEWMLGFILAFPLFMAFPLEEEYLSSKWKYQTFYVRSSCFLEFTIYTPFNNIITDTWCLIFHSIIQKYHDLKLQKFYIRLFLIYLITTWSYFPTFISALVVHLLIFDLLYNQSLMNFLISFDGGVVLAIFCIFVPESGFIR